MERTLSDIGRRIVERRERRGLTQEQLAAAANLHQSQVSRFERGGRRPSLEQAEAIASALGCSVSALLVKASAGGSGVHARKVSRSAV